MNFEEEYLKTVICVGNLTEEKTGFNLVDAFFGPEELAPSRITGPLDESLLTILETLDDAAAQIINPLRQKYIRYALTALKTVVEWVLGDPIIYSDLVFRLFWIQPQRIPEKTIGRAQEKLEVACRELRLPGKSAMEKILTWEKENAIEEQELKQAVETVVAVKSREIQELFQKRIFVLLPEPVQNNGITWETTTEKAWGAYCYYQGNYTSKTVVCIDVPGNIAEMQGMIAHETEHHIALLFREKYFREHHALDLAVVPLHTPTSVIDEGTAECAQEFLGLNVESSLERMIQQLEELRRMVGVNVAYDMNIKGLDRATALEILHNRAYMDKKMAAKYIEFVQPKTAGKINFTAPYVFNYYFGKKDYVQPLFEKARKKEKIHEFFEILYLNPYSRSTVTWEDAFASI